MPDRKKTGARRETALDRRGFLKAATLAGTGALAPEVTSPATAATGAPKGAEARTALGESTDEHSPRRHTVQLASREGEHGTPPPATSKQTTCGSDFMIDVMRNVGIEYVAAIPGN